MKNVVPTRPFVVELHRFGPTGAEVSHPVKVYPGGMCGLILTPDERAMEVYVEWLEARVALLSKSVEEMSEKPIVGGVSWECGSPTPAKDFIESAKKVIEDAGKLDECRDTVAPSPVAKRKPK